MSSSERLGPGKVTPQNIRKEPKFDLLDNEDEDRFCHSFPTQLPLIEEERTRNRNKIITPTKAKTAPSLRSNSLSRGISMAESASQLKHAPSAGTVFQTTGNFGHSRSTETVAKKPKKNVSEYYKKQNELLENFKNDNEQIMVFQRTRSRQRNKSSTSEAIEEQIGNDVVPLLKQTDGDLDLEITRPGSSTSIFEGTNINRKNLEELTSAMKGSDSAENLVMKHETAAKKNADTTKAAARLAIATLMVNITLMCAKALASYLSGSLSILSSLADSVVDITSGFVIYVTTRAIKKRDPYLYPRGRTRLEPIALIIISTVMGIASIMLIMESVKRIASHKVDLDLDYVSAGIMIATIAIKFALMLICQQFKNEPSISVLAQDHRNDCLSNFIALLCAGSATYLGEFDANWKYIDPVGAVFVSIYVAYTWYSTGKEHMAMLSGKSAQPDFINRIIKVCIDHDQRIQAIDTVYVYHWGTRFLVEVHIVLDETMSLKVAHDISESLQINIESLPEVERAFVHTDYEYNHQPQDEHKVV